MNTNRKARSKANSKEKIARQRYAIAEGASLPYKTFLPVLSGELEWATESLSAPIARTLRQALWANWKTSEQEGRVLYR